jgi:hypothetical protein
VLALKDASESEIAKAEKAIMNAEAKWADKWIRQESKSFL